LTAPLSEQNVTTITKELFLLLHANNGNPDGPAPQYMGTQPPIQTPKGRANTNETKKATGRHPKGGDSLGSESYSDSSASSSSLEQTKASA
jgi:hypothetical protein